MPARIIRKIINNFNPLPDKLSRHGEFGRYQPGTPEGAGHKEINVFCKPKDKMVVLESEIGLKEISGKLEDTGKFLKAKFGLYGEEIIEKEVKPRGNTGRIYLPQDWVGKLVKIIRID